ncbi:MAG: omptin family outer membrane protease [Chrysiogenales bacterium]|nr:MAG: omptin family outer membrane protease [Chrysiogenales bacterium]
MKKNNTPALLAILIILGAAGVLPALGQEPAPPPIPPVRAPLFRFDLENGFERLFFYTRYQIGGKIYSREGVGITHFPISELRFPLDVFMIYADLGLTFIDRITIHYNVHKNLHNRVGKMKDSDWVPYSGIKTIYSESDARLNAIFTDTDLIIRLFTISFFSLRLGAGFTHQYLYYRCSNVTQWSAYTSTPPYIAPPEFIRIPGKVLTYEINYYMFTLQITPTFTVRIGRGSLEITPAIRFSPYLRGRDIDDHLLRAKLSKGDSKGTAFMPSLKIRYIFSTRIYITASLNFLSINAKGKQNQSYYLPVAEANGIPGWSARIDHKLKSQQLSVGIGAGYSFEFRR